MEEKMQNVMVIGIAGGSGSGKTTLAQNIREVFNDEVVILCHDYYYKSNEEISLDERKKLNYDHPNSFDTDLLIQQLKELKEGNVIFHPVYSFVEHTRVNETVKVNPTKVIIIEGILIFENKELCDLMDIKVFVDTDGDVRIIRRLLRDVQERGRDLDSVINQYLGTVKPMHEEFVDPSKRRADIIIPEGGANTVALSMLLERIKSFMNEN
jgi:uridine kinase